MVVGRWGTPPPPRICPRHLHLCFDTWHVAVSGGGSTGLFIMAKCFLFWNQSKMSGVLQASFFFGYMGVLCYGAVLMLGAIGFLSSMAFVRYIYSNVKID